MNSFEIMLNQCETQAEKLCCMDIDDNFNSEVNIFNNYFEQLRQIIEKEGRYNCRNRVNNLIMLMNQFIIKLEEAKNKLKKEALTIEKSSNIHKNTYGLDKYQEAFRFNRRY